MIHRIFLILPLSFVFLCNYAQETSGGPCESELKQLTKPVLTGALYEVPVTAGASQFFSDDWLKGSVTFSNGLTAQDHYFKYNGYSDQLIWINNNYKQVRLDKIPILYFQLADKQNPSVIHRFEKIAVSEASGNGKTEVFAQVLHLGKLSLYVQRKVVRIGTEERKSDRIILDTYEKKNIYYFSTGNRFSRGLEKISRKNILGLLPAFLPDTAPQTWSGIPFSIRKEEELIRLTEWLNGKQDL